MRRRDDALPAVSRQRTRPGAGLPMPLLDLRYHAGRAGRVRPGRAAVAPAAPDDCRRWLAARGGAAFGRCGSGLDRRRSRIRLMQRGIRIARAAQQRTGQASLAKTLLRYVFPDHWSFLWGEIALYCFVVLVATGVYLALFFDPSSAQTMYHGSYAPLRGQKMSEAYRSVIDLSFSVKAGLLMRQTHHWAANVFIAAIVMHMLRVFFTGAYRKPREIIWYLGVTM